MRAAVALAGLAASALATTSLPLGQYSFISAVPGNLGLRHCDYQFFGTPVEGGNDDFNFAVIPALNGVAGQFSLQSVNYPSMYVTVVGGQGVEATRMGIAAGPAVNEASFVPVAGLSDPTKVSLAMGPSSKYAGQFITLTSGVLQGSCAGNYKAPAGDVILTTGAGANAAGATWGTTYVPPPPPPTVTIDITNVTHQVNPKFMGCHLDPGYTQQPRGWLAQMIYGESFEAGTMRVPSWVQAVDNGVNAATSIDATKPFNTKPSMKFTYTSGTGRGGLANRGMGAEGMSLQGGKDYNGYLFAMGAPGTVITIGFQDFTAKSDLALTTLTLPAGAASGFVMLNFSITPSAGTSCAFFAPGSDPTIDCGNTPDAADACIRCGGQFLVALTAPGTVNVGYVYLQPGTWGRVGDLPVLASVADVMTTMGINIIRQGGTVSQSFRWKDWRGPPYQRPSMQHVWGDSLVSGWGPFEQMEAGEAIGYEVVITLAYDTNSAADWADLVEYIWGNESTTWGALRIADRNGKTDPYNISIFELGNEQENPDFVAQVTAMEARAASVGRPGVMRYMYPTNGGVSAQTAAALVAAGISPARIMPDIHVGAGGALDAAQGDFNNNPGFAQSAINCETNAGTHDMGRALGEAADLNAWFSALPPFIDRMVARTASFCSERSGHFDGFSQGLSFFLPNMTWLQPPGHVHAMITQTWGPSGLWVQYAAGTEPQPRRWANEPVVKTGADGKRFLAYERTLRASGISLSAQASGDGKNLFLRVVNNEALPGNVTVTLAGATFAPTATSWTLSAPTPTVTQNTPTNPNAVVPVKATVAYAPGTTFAVPGSSFTVFVFSVAGQGVAKLRGAAVA